MTRFVPGLGPFRVLIGLMLVLFVGVAAASLRGRAQTTPPGGNGAAEQESPAMTSAEAEQDPARGGQPIAFSHRHHVTEVGLDCQLCHVYARRSPVAGIPSVETCAGCHRQVLSDRPEIQKVLAFWENEEPIPWIRVHDLPDYARFSHKAHVRGGVACAECHGDVGQMDIARQVESLSMGWCVTCHEARDAPLDCLTCHY